MASISHSRLSGPAVTGALAKGKKHSSRSPACMGSGGSSSPCRKGRQKINNKLREAEAGHPHS